MEQTRLLIDGELIDASSGATYENINPATEEVLGQAADATTEDVKRATAAARRAFDETKWATDHSFRRRCLEQLHAAMQEAKDEFRAIIVAEAGSPIALTYSIQCDETIANFGNFVELADTYEYEQDRGSAVSASLPSRAR